MSSASGRERVAAGVVMEFAQWFLVVGRGRDRSLDELSNLESDRLYGGAAT